MYFKLKPNVEDNYQIQIEKLFTIKVLYFAIL